MSERQSLVSYFFMLFLKELRAWVENFEIFCNLSF
jgi:hypothetical protein